MNDRFTKWEVKCSYCERIVSGTGYFHLPPIIQENGELVDLYFCKDCFENNGLFIEQNEDFDEYIERVIRFVKSGQEKSHL
jgi:hypothetical protein